MVLVENTRSDVPLLGVFQDLTEPVVTPFSKGCRWNTDVEQLATRAGLKLEYSHKVDLGTLMLGVYSKVL